jgi:hypothetical protein
MNENDSLHKFIQEWIKIIKGDKRYDQDIIYAIENSIGGLSNEELDEAQLLVLLKDIEWGENV